MASPAWKWVLWSLCVLSISGAFLPYLLPSTSDTPQTHTLSPTISMPREGARCRTKAGYVAASTKALLDQSLEVLRQGDTTAYARFLATEHIVQMAADVPVVIQTRHLFRHTIQIRPNGHIGAPWATVEAVHCP